MATSSLLLLYGILIEVAGKMVRRMCYVNYGGLFVIARHIELFL